MHRCSAISIKCSAYLASQGHTLASLQRERTIVMKRNSCALNYFVNVAIHKLVQKDRRLWPPIQTQLQALMEEMDLIAEL